MIIARILPHAGLGNQMFMYAAGFALSQSLGTELRICAKDFEANNSSDDDRPYYLPLFSGINERQASFTELMKICPGQVFLDIICYRHIDKGDIFRRSFRKFIIKSGLAFLDVTTDKPSRFVHVHIDRGYSPDFWNVPDNTMTIGYFESEKFFGSYAEIIRKKFTFKPECFNPALSEKVRACNSVAIHVRRSDKVSHSNSLPSDERYIKAAIEKMTSLTENPAFFVFSDDIDWCRKNLPLIHEAEYTFVEGQTPPQDMALMSLCRNIITGPSTFSWWGAWLTESPGKIIIAPDVNLWYKSNSDSHKDLLPERWLKIG